MTEEAESDELDGILRRLGIGGGGGGGGPLEVAAELGTGRRPGAGLSGRPLETGGWLAEPIMSG